MEDHEIKIGISEPDERRFQTIIGRDLDPHDLEEGAVFIGSGEIYLKLSPSGMVTLHGTKDVDEAVKAVLEGVRLAIALNPYYQKPEE